MKRVYALADQLLRVAYHAESERKEDLIQKILMCTNNLLNIDNENWKYWRLYGAVNDYAENKEEATKGFNIAKKLNPLLDPNYKKESRKKKILKLFGMRNN